MEILNISFYNWKTFVISIDLLAIVVLCILIILTSRPIRYICQKLTFKTIQFSEATIGIGSTNIKIKYDEKIKEIAYKIWVELSTRKISIEFDEDFDIINEVYDSWYEAFKVIRLLLEEIPGEKIKHAKGLIELTTKVLNTGLRPHLTKWQAKYRSWYNKSKDTFEGLSPQDIQKNFPEYDLLVADLKKANAIIINYSQELNRMIDK